MEVYVELEASENGAIMEDDISEVLYGGRERYFMLFLSQLFRKSVAGKTLRVEGIMRGLTYS